MELMRGGVLSKLIEEYRNSQRQFPDEESSGIVRQILRAVEYLHM
jgi:serine/threonine protein kinase